MNILDIVAQYLDIDPEYLFFSVYIKELELFLD